MLRQLHQQLYKFLIKQQQPKAHVGLWLHPPSGIRTSTQSTNQDFFRFEQGIDQAKLAVRNRIYTSKVHLRGLMQN
ncbi:MAG: hypothetical protein AN490_18050 [Anabaena sp. AL09]|nr:MAG: hypothetical protein AN490_18050 [Anabaena sp. AL09]